MFSFFRKAAPPPAPAPEPRRRVRAVAPTEGGQPRPTRGAETARRTSLAEVPAPTTITQLKDVPPGGLLTVGGKAIYRMPQEHEAVLIAIELGPRRAAILFDPDPKKVRVISAHLPSVQAALIGAGVAIEPVQLPCSAEILRRTVDNFIVRHSVAGDSTTNVRSKSKELFLEWLEMSVEEGATDIHMESKGDSAQVLLRIDGELERLRNTCDGIYTATEAANAMAYAFNILGKKGSNSDSTWGERKQHYVMTAPRTVGRKQISLRYQSLPGVSGPKTVCRLLNTDPNAPTLPFQTLGYAESQVQIFRDVADLPSGFVIFLGVTGSGKTTSLKTFIETHPGNGKMAFYSIEDPVEYPLRGVHQMEIQRNVDDEAGSISAFLAAVKGLMRSDPDGVSIGEIRDRAGAFAGQALVETGHMAFGTVHAHLLTGAMPRLTNEEVGMNRDVLTNPNMLSLLAYQALVPLLCPKCRFDMPGILDDVKVRADLGSSYDNEGNKLRELRKLADSKFRVDVESFRFRNLAGCSHCRHRGTVGLTVVAEMMIPDRPWLELSRQGKDYEAMLHYRSFSDGQYASEDMTGKSVFEHTFYKALVGEVDPRRCETFETFKAFQPRSQLGNPVAGHPSLARVA